MFTSRDRATRRTVHKTFRLTMAELALLRRNAGASGLPVSTYVRRLALGRKVRAKRRHVDCAAIYQLSRLGTNVLQLQRVAQESGQAAVDAELEAAIEELRELLDALPVP